MGQQVSIDTFSSSADDQGDKYWASFDPYPFKVGHKKLVYMGILNGEGPLKGQKCVVKTPRQGSFSKKEWMLETRRARVAMEMANDYNRLVAGKNFKYRLSVTCPITAEIDSLSDCMCINDILGKPRKKMKETDFVSIELYLRGQFEEFEYGWVDQRDLLVPEAFSHFTWCRSEGHVIVSNLQGVKSFNTYHFTSPVIHSDDRAYGSSDLGFEGIKGFFRLHKCNRVCRGWPRLGDGKDLCGWGEFKTSSRGTVPSAPELMPPPYREVDAVPRYTDSQVNYQYQNGQTVRAENTRVNHSNDRLDRQMMPQRQTTQNLSQGFGQRNFSTNISQPQRLGCSQGMFIDWREMFGMFGNPGYDNLDAPPTEAQFMWFVKCMRGYTYNNPPPPYYLPAERRDETAHEHGITSGDLDDDDDTKCLLPPPYTEKSVDPKYECITYL